MQWGRNRGGKGGHGPPPHFLSYNRASYNSHPPHLSFFTWSMSYTRKCKLAVALVSSNIPNSSLHNLSSVLQYLKSLSSSQQALISEVCTLAALIIVMPATNATSERTFSCLRRIKSYLRSSMTQTRLNSTMILSVHKEYTDQLDLVDIGNEFVRESHHRENVFGSFLKSDYYYLNSILCAICQLLWVWLLGVA